MKKFLIFVLLLVAAGGGLGYYLGWFSVTKDGNVKVDPAKFKKDKEAFGKSVGEKTKGIKSSVAGLWTKSKDLTGDEKARVEKELKALEAKHDRLEKQLEELEEAGEDKFETTKEDLNKALDEVEMKIAELTKSLEKPKGK